MLGSQLRSEDNTRRRIGRRMVDRADDVSVYGALVGLLLLTACALRVYGLGAKSVWLDEAFSIHVSAQPVDKLLMMVIRHDTPPPLYYLLLHLWMGLGSDPFTVRLLSALFGVGCVGAAFLLGLEAAGRREAMVAALLTTVSPFLVWYSQEARMYSLLAFLCTVSAYLLLRGLKRGGIWCWAGYVLATCAALYTQLSALFFFAGEGAAALVYMRARRSGSPLHPWLLSQFATALLWLPWLPFSVQQGQTYQRFWIDVPTPERALSLLFEFTSSYLPHWRVPGGMYLLIGGALLLSLLALRGTRSPEKLFVVALFVVPVAGIYIVSQVKPIFLSRAVIYASVPFILLLAWGSLSLRRPIWRAAAIGSLVLLNLISLYRLYYDVPKEQWDLAAQYVASHASPGELAIFVATDAQLPFDYYAHPLGVQLEEKGMPVDVFSVGPLEPMVRAQDLTRIDELARGRDSFWVVESHTLFADPDGLVRQEADHSYSLMERREFYGVALSRFRVGPAQPSVAAQGVGIAR
jgi:mannosyltransferase